MPGAAMHPAYRSRPDTGRDHHKSRAVQSLLANTRRSTPPALPPPMSTTIRLLLTSFILILAGVPAYGADPALRGDPARPAVSAHWQRAELYFGLGRVGEYDATAAELHWRAFLDEVVTPRFPDGFTVLDGYGQWQRRDRSEPERLNSKVLVILYRGAKHRADLDAIRAEWKRRSGDQSVLLTITPAAVSF